MEEIQNTELPLTHSFVYNEKRYPFNMRMFKFYSQYFKLNKYKIKQNNEIDLLDDGENINGLSEKSINDFIEYCQRKKIQLSKENAFFLNKLSKKYEVESLIKASEKFMKANHQIFVIQFILMNQEHENSNSEECEEIITSNLMNYIQDDQLLKIPIHILHRIVSKYFKENEGKVTENPEIIDFLFRCLDHYKQQGSVLFENGDFGKMSNKVYLRLLTDYTNEFDFHFINKNQLKSLYELSNEIIKREEVITNLENVNEISNKRLEEEQIKIHNEIEEIKREKDSQIAQLEQSFVSKIEESNKENERKISLQQEVIRELTEKIEQLITIIDVLNNQIKEQSKIPISRHFINESNPNSGIISFLNDSVTLSAGGRHNPGYALSNIKSYDNSNFFNYSGYKPSSESDSYIKFDFGPNKKVELTSYFIRLNSYSSSSNHHPKSWRVEGSNDDSNWTRLDHRMNDEYLNGTYKQHHYECQENRGGDKKYRYIRWIQEDSWYNNYPYYINITYFELYGDIFKIE